MYHKIKIGNLSNTQISRLLNGHGVRISDGFNHEIELSKEQLKKLMKATEKGKAMTLTLDPFQIQNHQHLRGSGSGGSGNLTRTSKGNSKRIITSATDRLIRALEGSGVGGNIKATAKDSGKRLIVSGTDRAIRAIDGSGVNRFKNATRWTGYANRTVRDGIDTAGKAARVYHKSTSPMAQLGFGLRSDLCVRAHQKDSQKLIGKYMPSMPEYDVVEPPLKIGFELKKRKAPKRKSMKGCALLPAGY